MKNRKRFWHSLASIFLIVVSSCGGGSGSSSDSSPGTGSIIFRMALQEPPKSALQSSVKAETILDCASAGVQTIEGRVYDENDSLLTSAGPWRCTDNSETISGVGTGANRKLVLLGKDSSGNNIYTGRAPGITIVKNQPYDAGTIYLLPFGVSQASPVPGSIITNCNFNFTWQEATFTGARYVLEVDDNSNFSSPNIRQETSGTSYAPPHSR